MKNNNYFELTSVQQKTVLEQTAVKLGLTMHFLQKIPYLVPRFTFGESSGARKRSE